ncbi:hypothetical protein [Streptomyces sp. NPDC048611]|uniref:hypothetical protein n=1 Tax=Streptomyces sp. NPDC048611 TaxID=3155635 RepID=UPI003443DB56
MTAVGRGRPPLFDAATQELFLALIADGVRVADAAAKCGVARKTPAQLAARDRSFAALLAAAKDKGRLKRLPHNTAGGYTNWNCRCPHCTNAASRARSNAPDRKPAPVLTLTATQPTTATTKLPMLARVS